MPQHPQHPPDGPAVARHADKSAPVLREYVAKYLLQSSIEGGVGLAEGRGPEEIFFGEAWLDGPVGVKRCDVGFRGSAVASVDAVCFS